MQCGIVMNVNEMFVRFYTDIRVLMWFASLGEMHFIWVRFYIYFIHVWMFFKEPYITLYLVDSNFNQERKIEIEKNENTEEIFNHSSCPVLKYFIMH